MEIYLPGTMRSLSPAVTPITRDQLYNLDLNEKFEVQFNPIFEPVHLINWNQAPVVRTDTAHLQYLASEPLTISLALRFLVDPNAPTCDSITEPSIMDGDGLVNIEHLIQVFYNWNAILRDKRRPSLIRFISGGLSWDGVISEWAFRPTRRFPAGRIRDCEFRLEFSEWRTRPRSK